MRKKPNLEEFIDGGAAAAIETKLKEQAVQVVDEGRSTKSIRLTRRLDRLLKEEAHKRTMAGKRTSESDLIEEALNSYFNI